MRWIPSANWHLTLSFIGSLEPEHVAGLAELVDASRDGKGPMALKPSYIGGFPRRKPRVIACGLDETPRLKRLASHLHGKLQTAGYPVDRKPFRPHVTVGRLERSRAPVLVSEIRHMRIRFDRLTVYRSETLSSGARYEALRSFEFQAPAA